MDYSLAALLSVILVSILAGVVSLIPPKKPKWPKEIGFKACPPQEKGRN